PENSEVGGDLPGRCVAKRNGLCERRSASGCSPVPGLDSVACWASCVAHCPRRTGDCGIFIPLAIGGMPPATLSPLPLDTRRLFGAPHALNASLRESSSRDSWPHRAVGRMALGVAGRARVGADRLRRER